MTPPRDFALAAPLDASGRIARDLECAGCGYNLRTQPAAGLCTECGRPCVKSLHGHWLRTSDARWLGHLARGVATVPIGALLSLLLLFAIGISPAIGVGLSIAGTLAEIVGVYLSTLPEPGGPGGGSLTRFVLRVLSFGVLAPHAGLAAFIAMFETPGGLDDGGVFWSAVLLIAVLAGIAVCFVWLPLYLWYLSRFLARIPHPKLVRTVRAGAVLWLLATGVFFFGWMIVGVWTAGVTAAAVTASAPVATTGATATAPASMAASAPAVVVPPGTMLPGGRLNAAMTALAGLAGCLVPVLLLGALVLLIILARVFYKVQREAAACPRMPHETFVRLCAEAEVQQARRLHGRAGTGPV